MPHSSNSANDGPREKLRAWKASDGPLPDRVYQSLKALEKSGDLRGEDAVHLKFYEAWLRGRTPPGPPKPPVPPTPVPPPPSPDHGDSRGLADLLGLVEAWVKDVPVGAIRATPDTLGNLMKPEGHLKPGDIVVLAPGTYGQEYVLSEKVDGTVALPLVFVGAEGVVITGVVTIDNANTIAHNVLPAVGGRVRAGGFTVTR